MILLAHYVTTCTSTKSLFQNFTLCHYLRAPSLLNYHTPHPFPHSLSNSHSVHISSPLINTTYTTAMDRIGPPDPNSKFGGRNSKMVNWLLPILGAFLHPHFLNFLDQGICPFAGYNRPLTTYVIVISVINKITYFSFTNIQNLGYLLKHVFVWHVQLHKFTIFQWKIQFILLFSHL